MSQGTYFALIQPIKIFCDVAQQYYLLENGLFGSCITIGLSLKYFGVATITKT